MKQYTSPKIFLTLLFVVIISWPAMDLLASETNKERAETLQQPRLEHPAPPSQAQDIEDMRSLRQRYGKDPTGVRARLGMCRHGHGKGHGEGHGRGHGRGRGPMPPPHHPCPFGEQKWNNQP